VGHHSEAFIGIDTSKLRNAVAIAEAGREGEVRYLGEIDAAPGATRKLVAKLAVKYRHLTFCGPDRIRALPAGPEPRARLHRSGSVARSQEGR
jgi:hypothetical protein